MRVPRDPGGALLDAQCLRPSLPIARWPLSLFLCLLGLILTSPGLAEEVRSGKDGSPEIARATAGAERSQWELQMRRKWAMGQASTPQPLPGVSRAVSTSGSGEKTGKKTEEKTGKKTGEKTGEKTEKKTGEEARDSKSPGKDSVAGYLGPVGRIPSAIYIARVPDPSAPESSAELAAGEAELRLQELGDSPSRAVTGKSSMSSAERLFGEDFRPYVAPKEPSLFSRYIVIQTFWHPKSERRTARIAVPSGTQLQLQEGDQVGELKVGTIGLSGVVFIHDGVEVRRSVGQRS